MPYGPLLLELGPHVRHKVCPHRSSSSDAEEDGKGDSGPGDCCHGRRVCVASDAREFWSRTQSEAGDCIPFSSSPAGLTVGARAEEICAMKPGATKPTAVFKRADECGPGSKRNTQLEQRQQVDESQSTSPFLADCCIHLKLLATNVAS